MGASYVDLSRHVLTQNASVGDSRYLPLITVTLYRGPIGFMRSALDILTEIRTGKRRIMAKNATIRILKRKTAVGDYPLGLPENLNPDTHLPVPFSSGQ
jgi:hypothetical protein